MILRFLAVLLLAFAATPVAASPSFLHHEADVTLDPAGARVIVVDRIQVTSGGRMLIGFAPGFSVQTLTVDGAEARPANGGVDLGKHGTHTVEIRYEGPLAPLPEGRGAMALGTDRPVLGKAGAYLPAGTAWLPHLPGEAFTYRLTVRVPSPWKAVTSGRLVTEREENGTYEAVFDSETPQDAIPLMAGPWVVEERRHGDIRLRTYFDQTTAPLAAEYLDLTAGYIDFYQDWIGPYPFSAFHIVAGPLPVGLGYTNLTYIGSMVLRLPFIRHTSLGHEILHNWWGNGVYVDYARGNWAEGLTTFMADYTYKLRKSPEAARDMRLQWLRDYAALPPERDRPLTRFIAKTHDAAQVIGYHKAAMLFHMLREELGGPTFDDGIRRFWGQMKFRTASWADLEAAFEGASGRKLDRFFDQWLNRTGAPKLHLRAVSTAEGAVDLVLGQDSPPYALQVPVTVTTDKGEAHHVVPLEGTESEHSLPTLGRPLSVAVDPDASLFRRLDPSETPPILRDVTLNPETIVVANGDTARKLAAALMDIPPRFGKPDRGKPLLVIGTVQEVAAANIGPVPAVLAGRGTARVWAARRYGRAILVVEADDAVSLEALLRPLPHYTRRGYLVFAGSKAIDKGNWPPGKGPLTAQFE